MATANGLLADRLNSKIIFAKFHLMLITFLVLLARGRRYRSLLPFVEFAIPSTCLLYFFKFSTTNKYLYLNESNREKNLYKQNKGKNDSK